MWVCEFVGMFVRFHLACEVCMWVYGYVGMSVCRYVRYVGSRYVGGYVGGWVCVYAGICVMRMRIQAGLCGYKQVCMRV